MRYLMKLVALIISISMMPMVVAFSTISMSSSTTQQSSSVQQQQIQQPKSNIPTIPTSSDNNNKNYILRNMQQKHRSIVESFEPDTFNPHPLLTNCHLQTISGVFLRKNLDCAYINESGIGGIVKAIADIQSNNDQYNYWDERQRVTTSCEEDFFTVDIKYAGERKIQYQSVDAKGLVILIHGLESNSNSSLSTDMAQAYVDDGFDVVCMNFRGCCGEPNDTIGGYHLGFTDDLKYFLELISGKVEQEDSFQKRPVYLSGFSLGANVVIKTLGELGDAAMTLYNVQGAAVTGAPFDCERNIKCVDAPGFNRIVYGGSFLKSLKARARDQLDQFCDGDPTTDKFDFPGTQSATTIAEFENAFLAPVYGFEDNIDYYRQCSCYYFLPGVAVPLYIVNAGDDPFFDESFFPIEESVDGGSSAPIKMQRTDHGGHLGYMFHQPSESEERKSASWMPTELSRFISHVHNYDKE